MMVNIANPIYDSVFKYLMEDERIAKTLISVRQDMNVEDEFFSAIENRDTALMQKDKTIAEQGETIAEQGETIAEQKEQIRSMVKAMSDNGMSIEMISNITKIPLDEISEMTK